jgi:hypothetical protein
MHLGRKLLMNMIENRDTKLKRIGDNVHVEFYEDQKLIGVINYSDKSMYYVESAVENFMIGVMTIETINNYKE